MFGPLSLYAVGIFMASMRISVPTTIRTDRRILMKLSMNIMPLLVTSTFQAYISILYHHYCYRLIFWGGNDLASLNAGFFNFVWQ
jgi:hypothetical protein